MGWLVDSHFEIQERRCLHQAQISNELILQCIEVLLILNCTVRIEQNIIF